MPFSNTSHSDTSHTHRCLHGTALPHLAEMFHRTADVASRRRLRSAATSTLVLPLTRQSTLFNRAFPVAASRAWNSLPASVRDIQKLPAFRQKLKLTLFSDSCQLNLAFDGLLVLFRL